MNPVSVELMITSYLISDTALIGDALGGIYAYTALGLVGITRETFEAAYDSDGYVLPLIVVKARSPIPDFRVNDEKEQIVAQTQAIEFWMYQFVGYDTIEILDNHVYRLMQGHQFPGYYPAVWQYTTGPLQDMGSLNGASVVRKDFTLRNLKLPT